MSARKKPEIKSCSLRVKSIREFLYIVLFSKTTVFDPVSEQKSLKRTSKQTQTFFKVTRCFSLKRLVRSSIPKVSSKLSS